MQLNEIQQEYKNLVDSRTIFDVRGCSLFAHGRQFPVSMAKHIGIKPKAFDNDELQKAWNKC